MSLRFAASSPRSFRRASSRSCARCQQTSIADLADVELQRIVGGGTSETGKLARGRHFVCYDSRVFIRHVEQMLCSIAFHGACIGRELAPLEG